jgi:hypothetical protein
VDEQLGPVTKETTMAKKKRQRELRLEVSGRIITSAYAVKKRGWKRAVPLYVPKRIANFPK